MTLARELTPSAADRHGLTTDARWLSICQIAADLGASTSTAYKWSARGAPGSLATSASTTATSESAATGTKPG